MINTYHVVDVVTSIEYDISVDINTIKLLLERHIVELKEDKGQWQKEADQQQD